MDEPDDAMMVDNGKVTTEREEEGEVEGEEEEVSALLERAYGLAPALDTSRCTRHLFISTPV